LRKNNEITILAGTKEKQLAIIRWKFT